jgi:hypothetical protein
MYICVEIRLKRIVTFPFKNKNNERCYSLLVFCLR